MPRTVTAKAALLAEKAVHAVLGCEEFIVHSDDAYQFMPINNELFMAVSKLSFKNFFSLHSNLLYNKCFLYSYGTGNVSVISYHLDSLL